MTISKVSPRILTFCATSTLNSRLSINSPWKIWDMMPSPPGTMLIPTLAHSWKTIGKMKVIEMSYLLYLHLKPEILFLLRICSVVRLLIPRDTVKDQTFFLSGIDAQALRHTMFPLAPYTKSEVRQLALDCGLERLVSKKESTGICFIGNRNFQKFIEEVGRRI